MAVDESWPIVMSIAGAVAQVASWPINPGLRAWPVAMDIWLRDDEVWLTSPAAGGVVAWSLGDDSVTVIPLDRPPGLLAALGNDVIVFGHPDWTSLTNADPSIVGFEHPVLWRDPPDPMIRTEPGWLIVDRTDGLVVWDADSTASSDPSVDEQAGDRGWFLAMPAADNGGDGYGPEEPLDDSGDSDEPEYETDRPVWRLRDGAAAPFDIGGDAYDAVPLPDGALLVVVRRRSDPLVKVRHGHGSISFGHPQAVLRFEPDRQPRVLAVFEEPVELFGDGDRCWVCYDVNEGDATRLAALDPVTGELTDTDLAVNDLDRPIAVCAGVAVVIVSVHSDEGPSRVVRSDAHLYDLETAAVRVVAMPVLARDVKPAIDDSHVWFVTADHTMLAGLDIGNGDVQLTAVDVDISRHIPAAVAPPGLDTTAYDRATAARLRDELDSGWTDEAGRRHPYIEGITIIGVEATGAFPDTAIEVRFRADDDPTTTFLTSFEVYDALGNKRNLDDASLSLKETIESIGGGLPPPSHRIADEDGVVRFPAH